MLSSDSAHRDLAQFLGDKLPALSAYFCHHFIGILLNPQNKSLPQLHAVSFWPIGDGEYTLENKQAYKDFFTHLGSFYDSSFALLIQTALLDLEGNCLSFPEFSTKIEGYKYHPIIRLSSWVVYMTQQYPSEVALTGFAPDFETLRNLNLVDQFGFPYFEEPNGNIPGLGDCLGFAVYGDYTNLDWLRDQIKRGNAIDWDEVKTAWSTSFVSSLEDLQRLLSVCPSPRECLNAVSASNLTSLLNVGMSVASAEIKDLAIELAKRYLTFPTTDTRFNVSAWILFVYSDSLNILRNVDLFPVFEWASQNAFDMLQTNEPEEKDKILQAALIRETIKMAAPLFTKGHKNKFLLYRIYGLWSFLFDRLLIIGPEEDGIPYCLAYDLALLSPYPPRDNWPPLLKALVKILAGKAELAVIESILYHPIWNRFHSIDKDDVEHLPEIPVAIVEGVIKSAGSELSMPWQRRILSLPLAMSDDLATPPVIQMFSQVLKTMDN